MNSTEYYASAEKAIADFTPVLQKMFPDMVTARVTFDNGFQDKSSLSVALISPWKVTRHNANVNFVAMLHLTTNFGKVEDMDKFSLENLSIPRKFKYRKMSAKTPYLVVEKFVKWLEKNKEMILEEAITGRF